MLCIVFEPHLSKVKNHFKNSRSQIFTKIESICRGHTPNLSTKFHPNPSTTFWDIVLYIVFGHVLSIVKSHSKYSSSRSGSGSSPKCIQLVLSHTEPAHQISSESVHNFLRYPAHRQTDRQTSRQATMARSYHPLFLPGLAEISKSKIKKKN